MPIYRYITIEPDGSEGEEFEVEQSITSEPLKFHPENNKPVKRIYDKLNINVEYTAGKEKSLSDISRIKKAGFTVLEKDKLTGNYYRKQSGLLLKIFDDNAVPARNMLIENGIETGEIWNLPTNTFPITIGFDVQAG